MNREWFPLYTTVSGETGLTRCCFDVSRHCLVNGGWVGWATIFMLTCTSTGKHCYRCPSQWWGLGLLMFGRILSSYRVLPACQATPASALAGSLSLVEAPHHWPRRKGYLTAFRCSSAGWISEICSSHKKHGYPKQRWIETRWSI